MQPIRGFRDLLGSDYSNFSKISKECESVALLYGYEGLEQPLIEDISVFHRTLGNTSDIVNKEMFTLQDRNNETLALRPEGTAGVVRALLSNKLTQELPRKFFYKGPMFRYERPQKGRYRQFYQFGVEAFGIADPYMDAEVIIMAHRLIKNLGIEGAVLEINTIGDAASRKSYNQALVDYLTPYRAELSEDSQKRLDKNPLRILDSKDDSDKKITQDAPKFDAYLNTESKIFFEKVLILLDSFKVDYSLNPYLVRGLDYYCHTLFEFKHNSLGAQDTFLGGGRYDGLVETMGGPATPGVGWAIGIDRVMFLTPAPLNQVPIVIIPFDDKCMNYAFNIAEELRSKGLVAELSFKGKMAKDLKYADRCGAKYVLLIGDNEVKAGTVTLKTMVQGVLNENVGRDKIGDILLNMFFKR